MKVRATGPDLTFVVRFNGEEIHRATNVSQESQEISHEFDDSIDAQHQVEFELLGKQKHHTKIDTNGDITQDRLIEISDVSIDDIELGYLFSQNTEYHHDYNGTGKPIADRFYDSMGCNGVARFRFSSPVYLWLLENM